MTITPIVTMFQTLTNTKMPQVAKELLLKITNCLQQQRFTLFKILTPTVPQDSNINSFLPPNRLYPKQRHSNSNSLTLLPPPFPTTCVLSVVLTGPLNDT